MFGLNDFDETLRGPFEYDVKPLAASFTIARNNGFTKADGRTATLASVRSYREHMADYAAMRTLDIWYAHLSAEELMQSIKRATSETKKGKEKTLLKRPRRAAAKQAQKAHARDSVQALSKLAETVDGHPRISSASPRSSRPSTTSSGPIARRCRTSAASDFAERYGRPERMRLPGLRQRHSVRPPRSAQQRLISTGARFARCAEPTETVRSIMTAECLQSSAIRISHASLGSATSV